MRRAIIGIAISLAFLFLALRGQDYPALLRALRDANYWWLVPAVLAYFLSVAVRSLRWSVLLRPVCRASPVEVFPIIAIGYMANNVLPFRTGEVLRAYALSRRFGASTTGTLATIVVERLLDGLTMVAFILVASVAVVLDSALRHVLLVAAGVFLPTLMVALVAARWQRAGALLEQVIRLAPTRVRPRAERMVRSGFDGIAALRHGSSLGQVIFFSVIAWLFEAAMYGLVARGFGLDLSVALVLLATAAANLATLIPSSPGYIGPFEAGIVLVLSGLAGLPRASAFSYAIVLHGALYVPITLVGLAFWWQHQLGWSSLRRTSVEEASGS
ncbi:MAG: flippase-like domain-containing protein [Thermomicrobium sp.]|nr:flippase-like domain-containing protein [Thermomicrobium sp.]MDW7981893.1 lysylphosphatidylglycerol synthase transmembrane domain-containing protein [Thermomicrobium sp.]